MTEATATVLTLPMTDESKPSKGPRKASKPRSAPKAAQAPTLTRKAQKARQNVVRWAHRYTYVAVGLSAGLNAYSACHNASDYGILRQVASGAVSAMVPLLVWGLAQLAGWLTKGGLLALAKAAGAVGIAMLTLSLWHVSEAIHLLTGQGIVLAVLLAIGIDCGLVVSELSAIVASDDESH